MSGAYTDSAGIGVVRDHIAEYISARDGYPADPSDIFIGTGASGCIKVRSYNFILGEVAVSRLEVTT